MNRIVFNALTAFALCSTVFTAAAQTFSTPAYNGTGAASGPAPNNQTSTNFNSSLGQNPGTNLGQNVAPAAVPNNPALDQPSTALGQPSAVLGQQGSTAIGQQGTTAIGQQNTTAIGQQGTGTAIIPQGTNGAANPLGTGSGVAAQGAASNAPAGTITNGFIVNSDGTVTALPGAGSTAAGTFGGTNTGAGSSLATPGQTNNTQQNP